MLNKELLASVVLPKYFNHSKFESFNRQVNGWGFKVCTTCVLSSEAVTFVLHVTVSDHYLSTHIMRYVQSKSISLHSVF